MEYECCACKAIFPAEAAVDGFGEGYRVGFMCPACGANLVERGRVHPQGAVYVYVVNFFAFVGLIALIFSKASEIGWPYYVGFLAAMALALVYGRHRYPMNYKVRGTALGPGRKNPNAGV